MSYPTFLRRFLLIIITIVTLLGAWLVRRTLTLAFSALVLAVALSIPVRWLQRRRWPRSWAIVVTMTVFLLITSLILAILLPDIFTEIGRLLSSIPAAFLELVNLYEQFRLSNEMVATLLPPLDELSSLKYVEALSTQLQGALSSILETGVPVLLSGVGSVAVALVNFFLVFFLTMFLLIDPLTYVRVSFYLVPESSHAILLNLWNELYRTLTTWIRALLFSIAITVFLVWFVLGVLIGMPNALTVAVFAGVATLIPNIGFWLPLLPILVFNLAGDPSLLTYVIPAYLIIQTVESNIITPSIVKAELKIPAAGMMVCQIIIGILLGPLGLLLAVPMVAALITIIREVYSFGWLGLRGKQFVVSTDNAGRLEMYVARSDAD